MMKDMSASLMVIYDASSAFVAGMMLYVGVDYTVESILRKDMTAIRGSAK